MVGKIGYHVEKDGTDGIIQVKLSNILYRVVIDPGHGDQDPGAATFTGKKEKDFNLAMGNKVMKLLEAIPQIQAYTTRSDDTFLTLQERSSMANTLKADVYVSIHGNSFPNNPSVNGVETYYNRSDESVTLANIIHRNVVAATGFVDRSVRFGDLHVVRETTMPATLVEVGYLSNQMNEAAMFTEDFQNRVAQAIVNGIKEFLKIQ
ncbi:N-acetylmuramoyl-L-alanine amidase family protein [Gorillibacterium massiliense]|uniref:N-acetylmuramoyl-L-alanine amidase family protein n=1 Tax=Gorillibacterium massiliense TaxID=1280390 RepID=UPI001EE1AC23|nr:N-acetylmuramoyl-L-alanine amidase [Gorillibacterium massiliense]